VLSRAAAAREARASGGGDIGAEPNRPRIQSGAAVEATVRVINQQMSSRFPQIDYVADRIHRRLFQPHLDALIGRLNDALAATLLV